MFHARAFHIVGQEKAPISLILGKRASFLCSGISFNILHSLRAFLDDECVLVQLDAPESRHASAISLLRPVGEIKSISFLSFTLSTRCSLATLQGSEAPIKKANGPN